MNQVSKKRREWLAEYRKLRDSIVPTECARCGIKGEGWSFNGGMFEPHHPYRRTTRWAMLCFIPLCASTPTRKGCHEIVEDEAKRAREEGWIVNPRKCQWYENE